MQIDSSVQLHRAPSLKNDTFILSQIPRMSFGSDSEGAV